MEPFKNALNEARLRDAAAHLHRAAATFDADRYVALALDGLDALELKARVAHIADALAACLPADWPAACAAMVGALGAPTNPDAMAGADTDPTGIRGWMVWPMTHLVGARGLDDPSTSLPALHAMTQRFSAEFAIRHFLLRYPDDTLATLRTWSTDPSAHVRRLVSEGTRPRLPWGVRLRPFVADPTPTIALLDRLVDDPSAYVRRSVANHLGDIAKDHADLAVETANRWLVGASRQRAGLVRHGLRWLVKRGHPGALAALGYGPAEVSASLAGSPTTVRVGESVGFTATIASTSDGRDQPLMIDYAVHHVRANGATSPKVFKWARRELPAGGLVRLDKRHSLRPVSTRRYYPGTHRVTLQVNGATVAEWAFELLPSG